MLVVAALTVANVLMVGVPLDFTSALFTDTAPAGGNAFTSHPCFPTGMYVWDLAFISNTRGRNHDERLRVTVRRDNDADCTAEATDAAVSGATVTLELWRQNNTPGNPNDDILVGTDTGTTNNGGQFTTNNFRSLPNDTYYGRVVSLAHPGYFWKSGLDRVTSPTHNIPH